MDESGDFGVIVGTGGTILHFDGTNWNPVLSPTANDLYDVHGLAPNDAVASGDGVILRWDGLNWTVVRDLPGTPYTPILLTSTRIWYGIPNSQFPIIGRCDRSGMGCLGLVAETGSVLELQEMPSGQIAVIGVLGDIYQVDDGLTQTPIYDHPTGQSMEFTAATVLGSSLEGAGLTAYGSNFLGLYRWQGTAWQFMDDPGGDVYAMKESPHPARIVEGVGISNLGNGMVIALSLTESLIVEEPLDVVGVGLADLAFTVQTFGFNKQQVNCETLVRPARLAAADGEIIFTEQECWGLFLLWRSRCSVGNQEIDVLNFVSAFNECNAAIQKQATHHRNGD